MSVRSYLAAEVSLKGHCDVGTSRFKIAQSVQSCPDERLRNGPCTRVAPLVDQLLNVLHVLSAKITRWYTGEGLV